MKHLKDHVRQELENIKDLDEFWHDINKVVKELNNSDNFYAFWSLKKKYPEFVNRKSIFHDKIIVPLHNHNRVARRIPLLDKIMMYMTESYNAGSLSAKTLIASMKSYPDFKTWFYEADLKIYRGIPKNTLHETDLEKCIQKNEFKSYTLSLEKAILFTKQGWAAKVWTGADEKKKDGYVFEGTIKPYQVHIFQNEGYEEECVIKGPWCASKVYRCVAGKLSEV